MFKSAEFIDEEKITIKAIAEDGTEYFVPVSEGNKDYRLIKYGDKERKIKKLRIRAYKKPKKE